jgi:molybdopterin-containing oxidoreductase family iron-sulfur binding subunit
MSEWNARKRRLTSLTVVPSGQPTGASAADGDVSRRDFLTVAGFGLFAACLSGCGRAPLQEAIPPLTQLEDIVPGTASYYASTCGACSATCGMLVKTHDGRPTKLEGNPEHPLSRGGLCAAGQASLLGLYDRLRVQRPLHKQKEVSWSDIDAAILAQIHKLPRNTGVLRVLSGTITSPTTRVVLDRFLGQFQNARHVVYDPVSCSAVMDAHEQTHGVRALPRFLLDKADVVVGIDADFLGTWIAPVQFTAAYRAGRVPTGDPVKLSHHAQVESRLSLTGGRADERLCVAPHEMRTVLGRLATGLARHAGVRLKLAPDPAKLPPEAETVCDQLTSRLWAARGRSLVLCGIQDVSAQVVCNFINDMLKSYGTTLDIERPSYQRAGSDAQVQQLIQELREQRVDALFVLNCNPVADLPEGAALAEALKMVPLLVCCTGQLDETANVAEFVCPEPHYLESWGDAEPVGGVVSIRQPTIPRLGNTRSLIESLLVWSGQKPRRAYDVVREHWQSSVFPRQTKEKNFQTFWDRAVHDGCAEVTAKPVAAKPLNLEVVKTALTKRPASDDRRVLVLYPKVGMPDGSHAYNPWLQELPDPVTKATWDNYACLSPAAAAELGVAQDDVVRIEMDGERGHQFDLELPVLIQPGQHDRLVAVALGYGRLASQRFASVGPAWLEGRPTLGANGLVGQNSAPLLKFEEGVLRYIRSGVKLAPTGTKHPLACTQVPVKVPDHLAAGREFRPVLEEITIAALRAGHKAQARAAEKNLWPADHPYLGHRWGMVIDLQACTGCSACVIACQSENNVPVVGRDEIARHREMHWLRIDRYYTGNGPDVEVAHQPMLCQHCERAPCETVCPVLATVHSAEGLNEQVYNRCVGTRYCANNCPYKVRRFNWFAYAHEDALQNMALNPDVTVRSRGVMEKCTFCVQRIEEAKIEARRRGMTVRDGDVQTACQQSCPAQAIVFGDINDPASRVARAAKDPRHYHTLAELNIGPAVGYLKVVRARSAQAEALANE